jgi:hypothetical protein
VSGRGQSRSGRGRFQGRARYPGPPSQETKSTKKLINDWNYYIGLAKQASEFEAITEFLLNHIKQNFEFGNNIAKAITTQELIITKSWRPSLQLSRNDDLKIKEVCWFISKFKSRKYKKNLSIFIENTQQLN